MTYPDNVTVMHRLVQRPDYHSDRLFFDVIIYSERHQRAAAKCFEDVAVYDYRAGKKSPLQAHVVDELREIYDLQERSRQDVEEKVTELHAYIERAEAELL